jgi:hypothetical protein
MKKTNFLKFLKDEKARVPFTVIGVFLILGSSLTTVYISNLENQKSLEIAGSVDSSEIENLLRRAEADMKTALNIAGLKGLKLIGEKPVVDENKKVTDFGTDADEINMNRVKQIIMEEMNLYLTNNYRNDRFNNSRYAINVKIKSGEKNPIITRDEITINKLKMKYKRDYPAGIISAVGPDENSNYEVYWNADISLDFEIKDMKTKKQSLVTEREININSLLTARYNLLKELVDEYHKNIDGTPCSAWTICTGIFNVYSLARGFQHYSNGDPSNVVDNDDLDQMINGANVLQQGLVFGSTDHYAVAGVAIGSDPGISKTINQLGDEIKDLSKKGQETYDISTEKIRDFNDGVSGTKKANVDYDPGINIKDIASKPIETSKTIILVFQNNITGAIDRDEITVDSESKINDTVSAKKGYTLIDKEKGPTQKNTTTDDFIKNVAEQIYTVDFNTDVKRESSDLIRADHTGFPIDNGSTTWTLNNFVKTKTNPLDFYLFTLPGDIVYSEKYNVEYNRDHKWSNKTVDKNGNVTWNHTTVTDKLKDEVWLHMKAIEYANYSETKNDINNAFQKFILSYYLDLNLQDTVVKYENNHYTPTNKEKWFKDPSTSGTVHSQFIQGDYENWVVTDSWDSINDIYDQIKNIKPDKSINPSNFPNPLELLEEAEKSILDKIDNQKDSLLLENNYKTPDKKNYITAGKKAVYKIREWYVNKIENDIKKYFEKARNTIDTKIDDFISKKTTADADQVKQALDPKNVEYFKKQLEIPILAYDRKIVKKGGWTEDIKVFVDQNPDYLFTDKEHTDKQGGKNFYPLKIRNICTLGPTGIPVLPPTPVTPWIFTFNLWLIDVRGEYEILKLKDTTDETHFNTTQGHEAQIYIRQYDTIVNKNGDLLGYNNRLNFAWTTVAMSFVPPGGQMVGDTAGGLIEETEGFKT